MFDSVLEIGQAQVPVDSSMVLSLDGLVSSLLRVFESRNSADPDTHDDSLCGC